MMAGDELWQLASRWADAVNVRACSYPSIKKQNIVLSIMLLKSKVYDNYSNI